MLFILDQIKCERLLSLQQMASDALVMQCTHLCVNVFAIVDPYPLYGGKVGRLGAVVSLVVAHVLRIPECIVNILFQWNLTA